jgi:hypothetical protein
VKAYTVPHGGACNTLLVHNNEVAVMLEFLANPRAMR